MPPDEFVSQTTQRCRISSVEPTENVDFKSKLLIWSSSKSLQKVGNDVGIQCVFMVIHFVIIASLGWGTGILFYLQPFVIFASFTYPGYNFNWHRA